MVITEKQKYKCNRLNCGYEWQAKTYRAEKPKSCPNCHSYKWDVEPILMITGSKNIELINKVGIKNG